jgi:DNA polymerase-3 subunit beta
MLINIRLLKAVAVAASTEQTRYYLNGVNLQVANGEAVMVATNGHMMLGARHVTDASDACACIIPSALIKSLKLDRKAGDMAEFTFDGNDIAIRYAGNTYGSGAVDGSFPNWRPVVPREPASGVAAQFNAEYLAAFAAAARIMGAKEFKVMVAHNGDDPALVTWHDEHDTFGVLMPLRASSCNVLTTAPGWARA